MALNVKAKSMEAKMAKKSVEAPKGIHWMKSGNGFMLMKYPAGKYKPHIVSSLKASFEIQKIHKGK